MLHYLLYEFILLFNKTLQSFFHFCFKPNEEPDGEVCRRTHFMVQLDSPQPFPSDSPPFTVFLFDDDLVSKLGLCLVGPPEFVCLLPVFWPENIILKQALRLVKRQTWGADEDRLCVKRTRKGAQSSRQTAQSCCRLSHFFQLQDHSNNTRSSDCEGTRQTSPPGAFSMFGEPPSPRKKANERQ